MAGYVTGAQVANWLRIADDGEDLSLDIAAEQAKADIDAYCGTEFGAADAAATAREFAPRYADLLYVDPISSTTSLVIKTDTSDDGTFNQTWASTDYQVEPLNQRRAGLTNHAYTRIRAIEALTFPVGKRATVEVTALWGWSTVPPAVLTASLMHAGRLHARRNSAAGVALEAAFPTRTVMGIDRDVASMLQPFRRVDLLV